VRGGVFCSSGGLRAWLGYVSPSLKRPVRRTGNPTVERWERSREDMRFKTVPKTWLRDNLREGLASLSDGGPRDHPSGAGPSPSSSPLSDGISCRTNSSELRAENRLARKGSSKKGWMALMDESDRRVGRPPSWG